MPVRHRQAPAHSLRAAVAAALAVALCWLPSGAAAQPVLTPAPSAVVPPATCEQDDGFWIISGRELGGQLGTSQAHRLRVWRFDAQGHGRPAELDEFYASLMPSVPVCVMVHGSFVDWETAYRDSAHTHTWLRNAAPQCPLHVVFFTWPSDDTPGVWIPIDVAVLGERAGRYGLYVAELVSRIPDDHPVSLIGHSHGARMVVSTLHLLGGGCVDNVAFAGGAYNRHRMRAVLAAAAFDHHWMNPGERYDRAIQRPEGILNLMNRRDLALGLYPLHRPLTTAAAARSGFTPGDRQEMGPLSTKIIDYDVTDRVGGRHIWPHYYDDPAIAQLIAPYVYFADSPPVSVSHRQPVVSGHRISRRLLPLESTRGSKWHLPEVVDRH